MSRKIEMSACTSVCKKHYGRNFKLSAAIQNRLPKYKVIYFLQINFKYIMSVGLSVMPNKEFDIFN